MKFCTAFSPTPFAAVKAMGNAPPAAGVPLSVAVPLPLSVKVKPVGNAVDSLIAGVGDPAVVTVNDPGVPRANVALFALVMASPVTFRVKFCTAFGPAPLTAVKLMGNPPPLAGFPLSVAVPLPLSVKVTPMGNAPDSVIVGTGDPLVVNVNDPGIPTTNVVVLPLVMDGARLGPTLTFRVKPWVTLPSPLVAVNVTGKGPRA